MTNIDSTGIENTESTIEQQDDNAKYEAEFAAALAEEQAMDAQERREVEGDEQLDLVETSDESLNFEGDDVLAVESTDVAAIEAEPEAEGAKTGSVKDAKAVKPKAPPAYLSFVAAVEAHAKALGLGVEEQKSYFQFFAPSGHKLYVEKALKKSVSRIDTSLPRSALVVNGKDISLPLTKPNGRIACHVDPSVESVKQALEVLASYGDKIPAPKKPAAKAAQPSI